MSRQLQVDGMRVATKVLTALEAGRSWLAGFTGGSEDVHLEHIRTHTLEPDGAAAAPSESQAAGRRQRLAALISELGKLDRRRTALSEKQEAVTRGRDPVAQSAVEARADRPAKLGPSLWLAAALVLLGGDAAFNFFSFCDVWGIDLLGQSDAAPVAVDLLVGGITVLVTVVVAIVGVQTADGRAPSRRAFGWVLLIVIAGVLAGIRASTTGETSATMAAFGFIATVLGGWASGRAHREIGPYLARVTEHRKAATIKTAKLATVDQERAKVQSEIRGIDAQVAEIRHEIESLRTAPERARKARAEFRQLLDARLAAARALYRQGARFAGREVDDAS